MPEITLTNRELAMAVQGLRTLGAKPIKNIRAAFGIAVIKRVAQPSLEDLERARIALCEQHAAKDGEGGQPVKLPDGTYDIPNRIAFDEAFNALLDLKVMLPGCNPIRLMDLDGVDVTPDDLVSLGPLVVADFPAATPA